MATTELAAASLGPLYAPDDPTLPKPWKGLIDGSTGVLYYWNPETSVIQYEKPVSLPPPLPAGPAPVVSMRKLAPILVAHSVPPSGSLAHNGQQVTQVPQQPGQQGSQHGHLMLQQQSPQLGLAAQQHGQVQQLGQKMQHPAQHIIQKIPPQLGQQGLQQRGQQIPQQTLHQMQQQTPQNQGSQMALPQGQQLAHQQLHYMAYQQSMLPQGQLSTGQRTQHGVQVPPFVNQQDFKPGFPKREEDDLQNRNQMGFSPSQFQQAGGAAAQNRAGGTTSAHMLQIGAYSGQTQQFGSSVHNMQQPGSAGRLQPTGTDLAHHSHGSRFQNVRGPSVMQGQQSNMAPGGSRMSHDNNFYGRGRNNYAFNSNKDAPIPGPQQPKLAAIPVARSQQDTRFSGPYPSAAPGHASALNSGPGHAMHNMYNHATGGPLFSNNAMMKPTYLGSSDISGLSLAEAYRQQHEVTATGDNVPAPFKTFEDTGFPPEILREAQTWPIALQSRDIVAIAKTGSGKTLGYLIPAFILLRQRRNNPQNGPTVLVLAPTRELATQIQDEVMKFGRSSRVSCTCLYSGAPKSLQRKELDRGADIVVATPGRLNDILEMKKIDFGQVSLLVLDEADRMLDMGFEPQIRKIVNEIPPHRQTLMYTATWPKK